MISWKPTSLSSASFTTWPSISGSLKRQLPDTQDPTTDNTTLRLDGAEPFIVFVREFAKAFQSMRFDFKRQVAEKDLVVMHSHLIRQQGDRGMAVMDIFRLENGKIYESSTD